MGQKEVPEVGGGGQQWRQGGTGWGLGQTGLPSVVSTNTPCPDLPAPPAYLPAPLPALMSLVPACLPVHCLATACLTAPPAALLPACPQDLWGKVMWVWDLPDVQKLRLTISMANFRWVALVGGWVNGWVNGWVGGWVLCSIRQAGRQAGRGSG